VQEALDQCYRFYLSGGTLREARTLLAADVDDTNTQVTVLTDNTSLNVGSSLSIGTETLAVIGKSGTTLTCVRGDLGTTAAAHTTNDQVWINPKWSGANLREALTLEVQNLSGKNLYQMKRLDLRFVSSQREYNLPLDDPDEFLRPFKVTYETTDSSKLYPWIGSYEIHRDMPQPGDVTDDAGTPINRTFESGLTLVLHEGGISGRSINLWYKARYDIAALTGPDIDLSVAGVHTEAHDIVALGTALRLLPGREISRNLHEMQGPTRRAEEVPPRAELQAYAGLYQLYTDRLEDEVNRLGNRWPDYGAGPASYQGLSGGIASGFATTGWS
jgi:hypothetical protein